MSTKKMIPTYKRRHSEQSNSSPRTVESDELVEFHGPNESADHKTTTARQECLRRDWEKAKAKRESANARRLRLRATQQSNASAYKAAKLMHIKALREERRLFEELINAPAPADAAELHIDASQTTVEPTVGTCEDLQDKNTSKHNGSRKRKRGSDQYIQYKKCDEKFREWLSSVTAIKLDTVDYLLVAMQDVHDRIVIKKDDMEIPEYLMINLNVNILLRKDTAQVINDFDEGHAHYVSILQECRNLLEECLGAMKARNGKGLMVRTETPAINLDEGDAPDERCSKRRRLMN